MSKQISISPERVGTNPIGKFGLWITRRLQLRAFWSTFKTGLRVPITDLYHPAQLKGSHYPSVPHRYRGLLALSREACTGCKKCERICPNNTIIMETRIVDGKEYRFPGYFAGRCMLCGLCEEVCDRQWAIRHTDQFEDAAYRREQLYYGPERMWDMWDKHIEPRIQAGITHKAVPDKRRTEREIMHSDHRSPMPEVPSQEYWEEQKRIEEEKARKKAERAAAKK